MPDPRDLVRWDVVEEHLADSEFLFEQWHVDNASGLQTFDGLARTLEARLLAHVDALAVGGAIVAEDLLLPVLVPDAESTTLVAAATSALVMGTDPAPLERVLARLLELPPGPAQDGIVDALVAAARLDVSARVLTRAERADDGPRGTLLRIVAARGGMPGPNVAGWVNRAAKADDPLVRTTAVRLAVVAPRVAALHVAEYLVDDSDPSVQCAAIGTALVHGSSGAYARAYELARRGPAGPTTRACMLAIALAGEAPAVDVLATRLGDETTRADAIFALGFTGRIDAVDRLMQWLADDDVGALAAEAIVGITGLGRDDARLWADAVAETPDDDLEQPLPPEDLDADLAPAPDDVLPVPVPDAFPPAWAEVRPRFDARVRFHEGRPLAEASDWLHVLAHTTMRRRAAIALEIAMRTRGVIRIPTGGMSAQQKPHLSSLASAAAIDGNRPFARIS
jgi:uncharacterized protein (TIGR02270 family)